MRAWSVGQHGLGQRPPPVELHRRRQPRGGAEGPTRSVLLAAVGSAPVGAGQPATEPLRTWLEAQLPPFAPDSVEVTGDGVRLSHRYASDPDGLVTEVTP